MLKIAGITIPSEAQYLEYFCIMPHKEDASFWLQDANTQVRGTVKTAHGNCIMPMAPLIKKGVRPALVLADALPVRSKFSFAGVNWTVCSSISKTSFAICDEVIAYRVFDTKTNVWEASELKSWLEEWLEYMVIGLDDVVYGEASFDKKPGDICHVGKYDMIVLEECDGECLLLARDLYRNDVVFGDTNNFSGSNTDKICAEFAKEIESVVGSENIVKHSVDLTSHDGLKDYGVKIFSKASLLTEDMYEQYRDVVDAHEIDGLWWLATPWSTSKGTGKYEASCISSGGRICNFDCRYFNFGVRPFCILKSSVLVS